MASKEIEQEVHLGMDRLRGRLAGLIEACGLPERQERSLVSTMKSITYDQEQDLIDLLKEGESANSRSNQRFSLL